MGTNYSGRIFNVGDTIYFSKFGTTISSGYSSKSGTFGTCHGKITSLYDASYAFPIVISGSVTAGTGGSFTGCTVKPADCSKGYQVTVTYNRNPNSGTSGSTSQTGYVGASLTGTASRTGYTFAGWYTSGGSKVTTIPSSATTYYAHWTAKTYAVTLDGQSATTSGSTSVTATYGSAMPSITKPTRTGYTFGGYYTSTNGGGTQYYTASGASARSWNLTSATILYANWTANTYSVHFEGNGATSGSMSDQTGFTYNTLKALSSNGFSRGSAWAFDGWSLNPDGSGTRYANQAQVATLTSEPNGVVTLYAQWKQQYVKPTIGAITAQRCTNGSPADDGTQIRVSFTWSVDTQVSSSNHATAINIKYRVQGASSWTELVNQTSNLSSPFTYTSVAGKADTDKTYDILVGITDSYGSSQEINVPAPQAQAQSFISVAKYILDFSPTGGVGICSVAPNTGVSIGDTIKATKQIKTSFKSGVAMGSFEANSHTVPDLFGELRFSSGCMGSANITTAYSGFNVTIPIGWYNFIYSPHRTGGENGGIDSTHSDNVKYGNLILIGMTVSTEIYVIRINGTGSGSGDVGIVEVTQLEKKVNKVKTTFTPASGSSYSNYGGCYYEKYGSVVHVHVGVSGLTTGTYTLIYTLPSDYRPSSPVYAHGTGGSWNTLGYVDIGTAGAINVRSEGTYCGAEVTYLV